MSTTTTLTSMTAARSEAKERCSFCKTQPFDLICTCGEKFDFNCIQQHVEIMAMEFQQHHQDVSDKLTILTDLQQMQNSSLDAVRSSIDAWKRKRIEEINDIAQKAQEEFGQQENIFDDIPLFQETYQKLSTDSYRVAHDNLNLLIELNRQVQEKITEGQNSTQTEYDDARLDALLQAKLNPSSLSTTLHNQQSTTDEIEPSISSPISRLLSNADTLRNSQPPTEPSSTNTLDLTQSPSQPSNINRFRYSQPPSDSSSVNPSRLLQQSADSSSVNPSRLLQQSADSSSTNPSRLLRPSTDLASTNPSSLVQPSSDSTSASTARSTQSQSDSSNSNTLRLRTPPSDSASTTTSRSTPQTTTQISPASLFAALSKVPLPNLETSRSTQPRTETTNTETVRSTPTRPESPYTETVRSTEARTEIPDPETQSPIETTHTERPKSPQPTVELKNTTGPNEITESTNNDEFEAGHTQFIKRSNPIIIPAINDKFIGTVCCHNNQLMFNDFDRTTQSSRLTLIPDIENPTNKQTITWDDPDSPLNGDDDERIQDIIYSDKLPGYLILNRSRLRSLKQNHHDLQEFHEFPDRTMKRLTSNDNFIYLTAARSASLNTGDEIILLNYDKEEQVSKTFRDIIPSRINRGAGALAGEISDIAAGPNNQITMGYRLERRHEVGVCVFTVTNDGKEWSCVKQLLLNDCWHSDLSYTPRIDWCEKLNVFLLIEYMTGHLIMIDKEGQVEGECRFMHVENRRESPINLSISTNDWFCVRYESSINIHKITA